MKNVFGIKLFHSSFLNNDSCTFHTCYSFLLPFTYLHDFQLFHFLKMKIYSIHSKLLSLFLLFKSIIEQYMNTDTISISPCFQLFNIYLHLKHFIYFPISNFLVPSVAQLVVVACDATFP